MNNLSNFDTSFYMDKSEKMLQPQVGGRMPTGGLNKPMTQEQKVRTRVKPIKPARHDHANPLRHSLPTSLKDNRRAQR